METSSRKLCIGRPKIRLEVGDGHGEVLVCITGFVRVELWIVLAVEDDVPELGVGRWTWCLLALKDADYHSDLDGSFDAIRSGDLNKNMAIGGDIGARLWKRNSALLGDTTQDAER